MKSRHGAWVLPGILALCAILAMASCGPSVDLTFLGNGGDTGGTGVGPVAGFGSVVVNGVEYDDAGIDGSNFFDDHGRTKAELTAGMIVKVAATGINDVSATGTATRIEVIRHVDGPLDDNGATLATNRMKVMGQTVVVDGTTAFDNVAANGLVDLAAIDNLAKAGKRPELEIHGVSDSTGAIHATFVHLWYDNIVAGRAVQVRGTVADLNFAHTVFTLGTVTVDISAPPAGLADGLFVEAKGVFRASDNTILSTAVAIENPAAGQAAGDLVKAEGYVKRIVAAGARFELVGADGLQSINWSTGTAAFRDGTVADLAAGARVVVEGTRNLDGTVAAKEISFRKPCNIRMDGAVTVPSSPPNSLRLFGKTVVVNSLTRYADGAGSTPQRTFGFGDIATDNTLRVSAFLDDSTGSVRIVAGRVERIDTLASDNNILQGTVESRAGSVTLTILGITVLTFPDSTEFLQADGTRFPGATLNDRQANFFAAITDGRTVVRARGTAGSPTSPMTANEVRILPTIDN